MLVFISRAKYQFAGSNISNHRPYLCTRCTRCYASRSPAFSVYLASRGVYQYSGLCDGWALGGQVFSTLNGDLAIKGIQVRCGSLAELTTRGNFGKFPCHHFRAGKARLRGPPHSYGCHADRPDIYLGTWSQRRHSKATPNRGALFLRGILNQNMGAPLSSQGSVRVWSSRGDPETGG